MPAKRFSKIGLFAKPHNQNIIESFQHTLDFLSTRKHELYVEQLSASLLSNNAKSSKYKILPYDQIGAVCDLIIVVGGDGSLLKAARAISKHDIPILGINQGRLGFLADIAPNDLEANLAPILSGDYIEETRFLLKAQVTQNKQHLSEHLALNDVVLFTGDIARMIEFAIYVEEDLVSYQRSDGLIAATPTGSTAYALSAGGPIVYPTIEAITLVPMFAHTLSSRPIVVPKTSEIRLAIPHHNEVTPKISCDGQMHITLNPGAEVHIRSDEHLLRLLHPKNYNYFELLRTKLGWNAQLK